MSRIEVLLLLYNLKHEINSRINNSKNQKNDYRKFIRLSSKIAKKLDDSKLDFITARELWKFGNRIFLISTHEQILDLKEEIEILILFLNKQILYSSEMSYNFKT